MKWLRQWWRDMVEAWSDPLDVWDDDFPDSAPATPDEIDCPDTQPTSPGALDSDRGELK